MKRDFTLRDLGRRIAAIWPAKLLGISASLAGFFVAYFWVLQHPSGPVTLMPLTVVDRLVGFHPLALPLYLSLWFYVSLVPALVAGRRELFIVGVAWLGLAVSGLAIFYIWPTAVPSAGVDWSQHPSFAFLKSVDASGNACPSLHVAFAVFSGVWLAAFLRETGAGRGLRGLNWIWCAGIVWSTIATHQHVFLDVVPGAVLGGGAAGLDLLRRTRARQAASCPGAGTMQR